LPCIGSQDQTTFNPSFFIRINYIQIGL